MHKYLNLECKYFKNKILVQVKVVREKKNMKDTFLLASDAIAELDRKLIRPFWKIESCTRGQSMYKGNIVFLMFVEKLYQSAKFGRKSPNKFELKVGS